MRHSSYTISYADHPPNHQLKDGYKQAKRMLLVIRRARGLGTSGNEEQS